MRKTLLFVFGLLLMWLSLAGAEEPVDVSPNTEAAHALNSFRNRSHGSSSTDFQENYSTDSSQTTLWNSYAYLNYY